MKGGSFLLLKREKRGCDYTTGNEKKISNCSRKKKGITLLKFRKLLRIKNQDENFEKNDVSNDESVLRISKRSQLNLQLEETSKKKRNYKRLFNSK